MKTLIFTLLSLVLGVSFALASPETVVEVTTSHGRGNGVFILINGQVRILTNAHVVGENSQVSVITSEGEVFGQVETLLGEDDLAVLKIQGTASSFQAVAEKTFKICTQSMNGMCEAAPVVAMDYSGQDEILTRMNGEVEQIRLQSDFRGSSLVPDIYVSGNYKKVWYLRVLTRDGVSGGAYFKQKFFMGLVTKVTRGMQNYAIAIPRYEIARVLKSNLGKKSLIRLAEGGDPGNGGGPSAEISQDQATHWTLLDAGCYLGPCQKESQIINPFANALNPIDIDIAGKKVAVFYQGDKYRATFRAASTPLLKFLEKENIKFKSITLNSPEIFQLEKDRQQEFLNLRWLRVWKKDSGVLKNIYPALSSVIGKAANAALSSAGVPAQSAFMDGVISLDNVGRKVGSDRRLFVARHNPSIEIGVLKDISMQVILNDQNQRIAVMKDLSKIWIGTVNGARSEILLAQAIKNPLKKLYISQTGNSKAVFVYSDTDLTRLDSAIIETDDLVYEFTSANPNMGVM